MSADRVVRIRAFAKINLTLRVLGLRADGYHDLRTVLQSVGLHDTLVFERRPGPFHIDCADPACPADPTNLIWRAAEQVWVAAGRRGVLRDVAVRVTKRIPVRAGLGGGSSDAAAAIRALVALWRVRVGPERQREIASQLGADVPFFFQGGTSLGVDRGDVLFPLADAPAAWVAIVVPPFGVSTADAYRWYDEEGRKRGRRLRGPLFLPASEIGNDLEAPVAARHPGIARLAAALGRHGAVYAAMSGSGSAVFGLFHRRASAEAAVRGLARRGRRTLLTRTLDRATWRRMAAPA